LHRGEDMRVLVIEDHPDLRDFLRLALEAQNYEVLTAANGREALAYLNGHRVDAILTDLFMPEMDGIETLAEVRKRFPGVRVIAMSGRPGFDYLPVTRELGVKHTLRKPFDIQELLAALEDGE
jgi:DNA-binding response OmpR family regulator